MERLETTPTVVIRVKDKALRTSYFLYRAHVKYTIKLRENSSMAITDAMPELKRKLQFFPVENENPSTLTPDQIQHFNEKGFICPLDVFSEAEISQHREYFNQLMEKVLAEVETVIPLTDGIHVVLAFMTSLLKTEYWIMSKRYSVKILSVGEHITSANSRAKKNR